MALNWRKHDAATDSADAVLQELMGHKELHNAQRTTISRIKDHNSTLHVTATGSGKSACYQIPAIMAERGTTTLVVSPLIALMRDQKNKMRALGIPALDLHSLNACREGALHKIANGAYAMVFTSPEQLQKDDVREALRKAKLGFMAVDEAHCISHWGHDFRPEYGMLGKFKKQFGNLPTAAFTATASPMIRRDILRALNMEDAPVLIEPPERPNLEYAVKRCKTKDSKMDILMDCMDKRDCDGASIIYCGTRDETEMSAAALQRHGIPCQAYHAGKSDSERKRTENNFLQGDLRAIAATNAFGMGIDKPDVYTMIHMTTPGSVHAYLQETGRAGRDGTKADCTLISCEQDKDLHEYFLAENLPDYGFVTSVHGTLRSEGETNYRNSGGWFEPKWGRINEYFSERRNWKYPVRHDQKVQASVSLLMHSGILDRLGKHVKMELAALSNEQQTLLRQLTETRQRVGRSMFDQILNYAQSEKPSQALLLQMFEKELHA